MWWDVLLDDKFVGFWEFIVLGIVFFEMFNSLVNVLLFYLLLRIWDYIFELLEIWWRLGIFLVKCYFVFNIIC